ncbi:hypothetical protein CDD82_293 [Ophiocordyceps australis]|uniref:Methyltransferase domain-containing protein n=1 Tax=Ophiocordyceps australis TaxID=1399860 RepID=A0A2C5XS89_9HYPO|nr:hypothetical protein CDD82_293 [Ophiocordyceps australis]
MAETPEYDAIGSAYNVIETLPHRSMEFYNVDMAIKPFLRPGMHVLDMACGTGTYTGRLLSLGASSVTGVDISKVMLENAKTRLSTCLDAGKVRLFRGDGGVPQSWAPNGTTNYFNLAFGGWFLNYASSRTELTLFFKTIASNLDSCGVFVGIVFSPVDNDDEMRRRKMDYKCEPICRLYPRYTCMAPVPSGDGWKVDVKLSESVGFSTWHLYRHIYEEAARDGGMLGAFEWRHEKLLNLDQWAKHFGLSLDEVKLRQQVPHIGVVVVRKNGNGKEADAASKI